jgi:hypothetical protein
MPALLHFLDAHPSATKEQIAEFRARWPRELFPISNLRDFLEQHPDVTRQELLDFLQAREKE